VELVDVNFLLFWGVGFCTGTPGTLEKFQLSNFC